MLILQLKVEMDKLVANSYNFPLHLLLPLLPPPPLPLSLMQLATPAEGQSVGITICYFSHIYGMHLNSQVEQMLLVSAYEISRLS